MIFIGHINIELLCNVGIIQVSIHSNIISKNFTYYKKKKREKQVPGQNSTPSHAVGTSGEEQLPFTSNNHNIQKMKCFTPVRCQVYSIK